MSTSQISSILAAPAVPPSSAESPRASPLTWLVFPALLAGVVAATLALFGKVPLPAAAGLPVLAMILASLVLERLAPAHRAWNAAPEGKDLALLFINRVVDVLPATALAALAAQLHAAGWLELWPSRWPLAAQVALGLVLAELIRYPLHRRSHRDGWLGRVHVTHHEPRRMYALNGPRLSPPNYLWVALANFGPMLLLGAPPRAIAVLTAITGAFVVMQHANVHLRFDGLNRWLATPDVHRHHHRADAPARGVNYAIVLVVLDRLFGTYEPAAPVAADAIGPPLTGALVAPDSGSRGGACQDRRRSVVSSLAR